MCGTCNKMFTSKLILSHHMYSHFKKKYFCKVSNDGFFLKSELTKHKVNHKGKGTFKRMSKGCDRWFKRIADLTAHLPVRDKTEWKCEICNNCTMSCENILKIISALTITPNGPGYSCELCNKLFKYLMQLK